MLTAIILANGSSRRWKKDHTFPKQLADINSEPLIIRTIRQFREYGIDEIFVVTKDQQIISVVGESAGIWNPGENTRWLTQTILSTEPLWRDIIFFSFGDVCWENSTINKIIRGMEEDFHAYGRRNFGETFGFSMGPGCFVKFKEAVQHVTNTALKYHSYGWMGSATYRVYAGLQLDRWGQVDHTGIWIDILGQTMDIDNTETYNKVLLAMQGKYTW